MTHIAEFEGEILPSYDGVNQPRYPRGEMRDTEMPCDFQADIGKVALQDEIDPDVKAAIERFRQDHSTTTTTRNSAIGATAKYIQGRKDILG